MSKHSELAETLEDMLNGWLMDMYTNVEDVPGLDERLALIDEKLSGVLPSCRRAIYDRILELEPSGDSSARNDIGGSDNLTKWPMEKLDEYLGALLPDPKSDSEDKDTEQVKVD